MINTSSYEIQDFKGIPSSASLMGLDACQQEDTRAFKYKRLELRAKLGKRDPKQEKDDLKDIDPKEIEPELILKQMLPTFTPINPDVYVKEKKS